MRQSSISVSKPPAIAAVDPPRVWILESTGAGANHQLLNVAAALGWRHEFKRTLDSLPRVLLDRLYAPARRRIPTRKRTALQPPWPDLVLFSGGRSVADALRIRFLSGGRSRLVCIGRPWAPLAWFDQVIVSPQYGLPGHPRVLHTALPLNRPDANASAAVAHDWAPRFSHLPRPWLGVLLGGDSGSYRFTPAAARALGRQLDERARTLGGALLITSSARTPPPALEALLAELHCPHYCYNWRRGGKNPMQAVLALADGLVVTADSASMPAEACATGTPVASFTPPLRWRARLLAHVRIPAWSGRLGDAVAEARRRLVVRGLWIPTRDMSRVHAALEELGLIRPLADLGRLDGPPPPVPDDMEHVVAVLRALCTGEPANASRVNEPGPR